MISLNPRKLNRCDWFLIAWVLYYLQGVVYSVGGVISVSLLSINLLVSMVYTIKVMNMPDKPVYFKGLNMLIGLFTIYGIAYIMFSPSLIKYPLSGYYVQSYNYLKGIYLSMLPIYPFYYFSRKGYLTEKRLRVWGLVFLLSVVLSYFHNQQVVLEQLHDRGLITEETTNNAGYLFLSCIPLLVIYRTKPLVQFTFLSLVMVFIVMGMKRGPIMIGAVTFVYFMFKTIKNSRRKYRFLFMFLSFAVCIGCIYFFLYQMQNSDYMMKRIEDTMDGNTSGRDSLYQYFWNYFVNDANPIQFLFGRGANGTLEIYYNYAHNDWLEIAVNQGLLGLVVYALYYLGFYKTWKCAINTDAKTILALMLFIFFAKTLFSMSYADMTFVATALLGYALANVNTFNSKKI